MRCEESVAAAREHDSSYELAVSLDALLALRGDAGPFTGGARRDALLARLDVVALPAPPLERSPAATAAG